MRINKGICFDQSKCYLKNRFEFDFIWFVFNQKTLFLGKREMFEYTKVAIRRTKSKKNRQYNGQKDKQRTTKHDRENWRWSRINIPILQTTCPFRITITIRVEVWNLTLEVVSECVHPPVVLYLLSDLTGLSANLFYIAWLTSRQTIFQLYL